MAEEKVIKKPLPEITPINQPFWDGAKAAMWSGSSDYAAGSSLMYRRSWWENNRWPESGLAIDSVSKLEIGSDNVLVRAASKQKCIEVADSRGLMVCRAHPGNSSRKRLENWRSIDAATLPDGFLRD